MTNEMCDELITFYIHPEFWPRDSIPSSPNECWSGFAFGVYCWTIQTYLRLQRIGMRCSLVSQPPEEGLIFAHRECLSAIDGKYSGRLLPSAHRFIVDICADLSPYRFANAHLVQNQEMCALGKAFVFVPLWPQPGLIPRDAERGLTFRNIGYFGNEKNLPEEFRSPEWKSSLANMGCEWIFRTGFFKYNDISTYGINTAWADYSNLDAVVAVRSLSQRTFGRFDHKPATKLYNSWLAGVPAVLGCESAFIRLRKSELDYLEAKTPAEALNCIKILRDNVSLRTQMIENGIRRAKEFDVESTAMAWQHVINDVIIPRYRRWRRMSAVGRISSVLGTAMKEKMVRIRRKLFRLTQNAQTMPASW